MQKDRSKNILRRSPNRRFRIRSAERWSSTGWGFRSGALQTSSRDIVHERKPGHRHQDGGALLGLGSLRLPRGATPDRLQFFPAGCRRLCCRLFGNDRREWGRVQLFSELFGSCPCAGKLAVLASRSEKCVAGESVWRCLEKARSTDGKRHQRAKHPLDRERRQKERQISVFKNRVLQPDLWGRFRRQWAGWTSDGDPFGEGMRGNSVAKWHQK